MELFLLEGKIAKVKESSMGSRAGEGRCEWVRRSVGERKLSWYPLRFNDGKFTGGKKKDS